MRKVTLGLAFFAVFFTGLQVTSEASDNTTRTLKHQSRYNVSLALEFRKKNPSSFERVLDFLNQEGPNGFASGFRVGDDLVMTAYHVVSGELGESKKRALGFSATDQLEVRVFVNGCKATVIKIDREADLALLSVCDSLKPDNRPAFQNSVSKDEPVVLIASPHGSRIMTRGVVAGVYPFRGLEYLSAKIEARDGYSGSPVYNKNAEVVGVFSGYDWSKRVALITPGEHAQRLLADYAAAPRTK